MWMVHNYNDMATTGEEVGTTMTEEQIEVLRKQIAAYATICEHLAEMYRSLSESRLDVFSDLPGARFVDPYVEHMATSPETRVTTRQRWSPTAVQLQVLEEVYDQENGSPSKQRMKDLAEELSRHGKISETNIIYWFQNRRARIKKKMKKRQLLSSSSAESEIEMEV